MLPAFLGIAFAPAADGDFSREELGKFGVDFATPFMSLVFKLLILINKSNKNN
jgi:hypothetical protein